jgi:hypothetical protein
MPTPVSVAPLRFTGSRKKKRLLPHAAYMPLFFFFRKALNKLRPVSPLMAAAAVGSETSVRWLLAAGACADLT